MRTLLHNLKTQPRLPSLRGNEGIEKQIYSDKACYVITEVGPAGEILEPKELRGRFHNAIGALVRDKLNPAIPNWKEVPKNKKNELWDRQLKLNFRFLEGKQELVKKCFQDHGRVILMLDIGAQQEVYPKGVNSRQRVR